jgi:hypothetical protein
MKKTILITGIFLLLLITTNGVHAQCAMCKATAETSTGAGSKDLAGINRGIIYLLGAPYVLTMLVGGVWYYQRRKDQKAGL